MGIAIPYCKNFKMMVKVVKKINQITRWLTIVITLVQGPTISIIFIELYLVVHFY
jgi:preprotein translocase subunit SecY